MQRNVRTDRFIWIDIMITLLTLELMEYFYYGTRAVVLGTVCVGASLAAELISLKLMRRRFTADDLTCVSDALIIALMLPAAFDYKIAAAAGVFAVVAAKNVFGGRLNMIFSPAAAAYVFMYTSWKNQLLMFTEPHVHTGVFEKAGSLVSSASHAFNISGKMDLSDFEILMGNMSGAPGAVSILLLAVAASARCCGGCTALPTLDISRRLYRHDFRDCTARCYRSRSGEPCGFGEVYTCHEHGALCRGIHYRRQENSSKT